MWPTTRCFPTCYMARNARYGATPAIKDRRDVIREAAPHAQDMTCRRTKFKNYVDEEAKRKNTTKSRVRAKVEHPFRILKRIFGFDKVRYRGLKRITTGCARASRW